MNELIEFSKIKERKCFYILGKHLKNFFGRMDCSY